jgi:hypothetical protein
MFIKKVTYNKTTHLPTPTSRKEQKVYISREKRKKKHQKNCNYFHLLEICTFAQMTQHANTGKQWTQTKLAALHTH